jgi:hypothetical protein
VPWTACLVVLGLGLRLYHYLRDPSMWHDEAALTLNVLHKGFAGLLGPLSFAEAAPPLFLWLEKFGTLILGDGTYALRLVPFLASCAALLLLVPVARRLLHPAAVPWAVLLFACSDSLLWHACEAKPYAVEVLCAVALLALHGGTQTWPLTRRLLACTLLAPVFIFLAYPGCFLCGGLLVAVLPAVGRSRRPAVWCSYGLLTLVIAGAFTALLLGPVHAQRCEAMTSCWVDHFPPLDRPWKVPVWVAASTCEVVRYCCRPTGQVLAALAVAGAILLWRRGQRSWVALLTVPVGLAVVASFLHAYPFGGTRVLAYATPAVVLVIAEGAAFLMAWLRQRAPLEPDDFRLSPGTENHVALPGGAIRGTDFGAVIPWSNLAGLAVAAVLLAPAACTAYRVVVPWDRADCQGAAAYVLAHRRPGEGVVANHWEYRYYFRHLGPSLKDYQEMVAAPGQAGNRLWLVTSGDSADQRRFFAQYLPPGDWRPLEEREFARTTVFLLQRPGR